jgi:hypothetical protein
VRRLAEVLLCDLEFQHQRRARHRAKQRAERLARHEIERTVLHLHDHVASELAVERDELEIGAFDAIGVHGLVVHEGAPHDDAAVRRHRIGQHVRAVSVRPAVVLRTRLTFAVGLDEEAAEIRNEAVDLCRFVAPPACDTSVERIGRGEASQGLGRREIRGQVNANAVRPERARDGGRFLEIRPGERRRIGVDAVDDRPVDAD